LRPSYGFVQETVTLTLVVAAPSPPAPAVPRIVIVYAGGVAETDVTVVAVSGQPKPLLIAWVGPIASAGMFTTITTSVHDDGPGHEIPPAV
jgi:hypothetical protein